VDGHRMEDPGDALVAFLAPAHRPVRELLHFLELVPAFEAPVFIDRQLRSNLLYAPE
jgi:hypothetical protein